MGLLFIHLRFNYLFHVYQVIVVQNQKYSNTSKYVLEI